MSDIFVYFTKLPEGIDEMIVPCVDGYTIYIDNHLDTEHQKKAYIHALKHIKERDFEKTNVGEIEINARK